LKKSDRIQWMARIAILVALASALHAAEALIPVPYVIPGAKLGLANTVSLYAIMTMGFRSAISISLLRTLIGSLLSGTFLNMGYYLSLSGALFSTLIMYVTRSVFRERLSVVGVSVIGAMAHNVAQLLAASLILQQAGVFFYLPYLLAFAVPTGVFTGFIARKIISATEKIRR